jgi:hypothetical protein
MANEVSEEQFELQKTMFIKLTRKQNSSGLERHGTVNRRHKQFKSLKAVCRHDQDMPFFVFNSVTVLTQLSLSVASTRSSASIRAKPSASSRRLLLENGCCLSTAAMSTTTAAAAD